jgi:hypothetical protein
MIDSAIAAVDGTAFAAENDMNLPRTLARRAGRVSVRAVGLAVVRNRHVSPTAASRARRRKSMVAQVPGGGTVAAFRAPAHRRAFGPCGLAVASIPS